MGKNLVLLTIRRGKKVGKYIVCTIDYPVREESGKVHCTTNYQVREEGGKVHCAIDYQVRKEDEKVGEESEKEHITIT